MGTDILHSNELVARGERTSTHGHYQSLWAKGTFKRRPGWTHEQLRFPHQAYDAAHTRACRRWPKRPTEQGWLFTVGGAAPCRWRGVNTPPEKRQIMVSPCHIDMTAAGRVLPPVLPEPRKSSQRQTEIETAGPAFFWSNQISPRALSPSVRPTSVTAYSAQNARHDTAHLHGTCRLFIRARRSGGERAVDLGRSAQGR